MTRVTSVSEEIVAFIFRVNLEAVCSYETLVNTYQVILHVVIIQTTSTVNFKFLSFFLFYCYAN
jgi:hypothetical protein